MQQVLEINLKWSDNMIWPLVVFGSLTVLITVFIVGWIWAERKPRTVTKEGGPKNLPASSQLKEWRNS
jgi:hypothetical protein